MPKKLTKKIIGTIPNSKFSCSLKNSSKFISEFTDEYCQNNKIIKCPKDCICQHNIVDCRGLQLSDIPENIPEYATELYYIFIYIKFYS
jgi:hypothetical protein